MRHFSFFFTSATPVFFVLCEKWRVIGRGGVDGDVRGRHAPSCPRWRSTRGMATTNTQGDPLHRRLPHVPTLFFLFAHFPQSTCMQSVQLDNNAWQAQGGSQRLTAQAMARHRTTRPQRLFRMICNVRTVNGQPRM
jgi:hypothetical protein